MRAFVQLHDFGSKTLSDFILLLFIYFKHSVILLSISVCFILLEVESREIFISFGVRLTWTFNQNSGWCTIGFLKLF